MKVGVVDLAPLLDDLVREKAMFDEGLSLRQENLSARG